MKECDKMLAVKDKSQTIGDFVQEFLHKKGLILAEWHKHNKNCYVFGKTKYPTPQCGINENQPVSVPYDIEKLLAEYFGINLKKVEEEKREILDDLRKK